MTKEFYSVVFQLASRNDCNSLFDEGVEIADEDWLNGLMARHPELHTGSRNQRRLPVPWALTNWSCRFFLC
jgi:hypothetical protein